MTVKWTRLHFIILILLIPIMGFIYYIGHISYITPLKNEVDETRQQLNIQQQTMENKQGNQPIDGSTTETQLKLPVDEARERLLLSLTDVALRTESTLNQITISDQEVDRIISEDESLAASSYNLQVSSPNYNQMLLFIQELENMERLININTINYNQDSTEQIDFSVSFSAYYSPTLSDLRIEAPPFE